MSQSLAAVYLHLIFSTKNRKPFLRNVPLRNELHAYLGGISKNLGCEPLIVGGIEDHVHLLCRFSRTLTISDWVKEIKRASSLWVKSKETSLDDFSWQAGYGAFSTSQSAVEQVRTYILKQEEHHQKHTFQDEFRAFLKQHQIEWDERYIWD